MTEVGPHYDPATGKQNNLVLTPLRGEYSPFGEADAVLMPRLLREAASIGVEVYVVVPSRMVVVEQFSIFDHRIDWVHELAISHSSRASKERGEVIHDAVVRSDIRYLRVTASVVRKLANELSLRQHWFDAEAICSDEHGHLSHSLPLKTLRCVRPVDQVDGYLTQPSYRVGGIPGSALTFDVAYNLKLEFDGLFIESRRVDELLKLASEITKESDPHYLKSDMGALFHIYRAAKKFSPILRDLSRAKNDPAKKKLDRVRKDVNDFVGRYGSPLSLGKALSKVFRVIDPKHAWSRGGTATATSFDAAVALYPDYQHQFAREPFITPPLGVLIMMAREVMQVPLWDHDKQRSHWSSTHLRTLGRLGQMGFKGEELQDVLARVLLESKAQRPPETHGRSKKTSR